MQGWRVVAFLAVVATMLYVVMHAAGGLRAILGG